MIDYKLGVSLDSINDEHLSKLMNWRNDPLIMRWCRQIDLIRYDQQVQWYDSLIEDPTRRMYLIKDSSYRPVGVCGLTSIDNIVRKAEFSLYIGPEYQRMGYAEKGLKTLFKHGFDDLNLNIIWGETMEGNPALRLFTKIGMHVEGVRRDFYYKDGEYHNATLLSIRSYEFKL